MPLRTTLHLVLASCIALALRLYAAMSEPYLHHWDERYHALVAKNMGVHGFFEPMLYVRPLLPYDYTAWCCNHVWVHKQPLFLWLMALSIRAFGETEFAVRLPSIVLSTALVILIYGIARRWIGSERVAVVAAYIVACSYYLTELTAGRFSTDHNDVAFSFFVTLSLWLWLRYRDSASEMKWVIWIGMAAGAAVLCKWLAGMLVYGVWGLYQLLDARSRTGWRAWARLALSIGICVVVFVPWQIYILSRYPIESRYEFAYNSRHVFEVLEGHHGTVLYYLEDFLKMYGPLSFGLIPLGLWIVARRKREGEAALTWALLGVTSIVYAFFSLVVQTKMTAYVLPVAAVMWIAIAGACVYLYDRVESLRAPVRQVVRSAMVVALIFSALSPTRILKYRAESNEGRLAKIENTEVYRALRLDTPPDSTLVINCKSLEEVELMFYSPYTAYSWTPPVHRLDSLMDLGYRVAAFSDVAGQALPLEILNDRRVTLIGSPLR